MYLDVKIQRVALVKGTVKVIRGIIKDSETVNRIKKENQEALQKDMEAKLKLEKQKSLMMN